MLKPKFRRGNLVRIKDDLGLCKAHFQKAQEAVIIGSYLELCGGEHDIYNYQVRLRQSGRCVAWYDEDDMILVDAGGENLVEEAIETELRNEVKNIFKNHENDFESCDFGSHEITKIFRLIEHDSEYFHCNDFLSILREWDEFYPTLMKVKAAKTIEDAKKLDYELDLGVLWDIFQDIKSI